MPIYRCSNCLFEAEQAQDGGGCLSCTQGVLRYVPRSGMSVASTLQASPVPAAEQEQFLDVINTGHGVVTTPSSCGPALFEHFRRIYSEGELVKVTCNVKIIR